MLRKNSSIEKNNLRNLNLLNLVLFDLQKLKDMKSKRLMFILLSIVMLLLIPLIAMQFTNEVNWTLADFIVAGALLLAFGLTCELAIRKIQNVKYRMVICLSLVAVLLLVWAELAVGVFGSPIAGS